MKLTSTHSLFLPVLFMLYKLFLVIIAMYFYRMFSVDFRVLSFTFYLLLVLTRSNTFCANWGTNRGTITDLRYSVYRNVVTVDRLFRPELFYTEKNNVASIALSSIG